MLGRRNQTVPSVLFGCLACLVFVFVVNADGRVFVLEPRNSSGLQSFRDAEHACASQHARLASADELRHAVLECFFSLCTQGWLYGGTVGTTVCNIVGGALKAVDVRTENATGDTAYLDAFCIKDTGVPCGDPPSFPNARLQGHSGFEMGDELLYTCAPGYVMPSGHSAFSLLCDSCGEWYGLVQICVKDETVSHVDYEDKFTDSYEEHHDNPRMEEAQGGLFEEESRDAYRGEKRGHQQQETSYGRLDHQDQQTKVEEDRDTDEERAVEDFVGHPSWEQEQESRQVERTDTGGHRTTEAPVSLLSQKHMFWFPSEAFQEEGRSVTETTQRASDGVSEESKDQESREGDQQQQSPHDAGDHHPEQETYDNLDTSDPVDHDDSRHGDQDDRDDVVTHYIPRQHDDLDLLDQHSKHDDDHYDHSEHYDMGEHEDDQVRHGTQGYDDGEDTYDHHESYEDHEDVTSDPEVTIQVHPEDSREHHDHDNHDNHGDVEEHYDSQEDHDNNSHSDHDGHDHDAHDSHDRHDSHEDDSHQQVFFSVATDEQQNLTKKEEGETTTDDTWLDGYPVVPAGAEKGESTTTSEKLDQRESGTRVRTTDRPNEVETGLVPGTSSPEEHQSPTQEYEKVVDVWPVWISTSTPHPGHLDSLDPSYSDTLDYDTQQPGPTPSWPEDLTEDPSLDQGPAPSLHENDILVSVMEDNNLPGEAGERGETEGELGETVCVGEDCPPHPPSSSMKGSTVTAVIVAVCLLAAAVMVGVWCYRRLQQKSSVYEMNGKGQSRTRQGQQIEMQQKV